MATNYTQEIADDIATLEAQLTAVRAKIEEQESYRSSEEGSSQSRFKVEFTDIENLYTREYNLNTRLKTLKASR